MADIRTFWDGEKSRGDWALKDGSLASDADLQTAVTLSLFTDARAGDDDALPDDGTDRRGWWADHEGDEIWGMPNVGSKLWLRAREKATEETRRKIENDIREALRWLIDKGVAARIEVISEWRDGRRLDAALAIFRRDGSVLNLKFENLWAEMT